MLMPGAEIEPPTKWDLYATELYQNYVDDDDDGEDDEDDDGDEDNDDDDDDDGENDNDDDEMVRNATRKESKEVADGKISFSAKRVFLQLGAEILLAKSKKFASKIYKGSHKNVFNFVLNWGGRGDQVKSPILQMKLYIFFTYLFCILCNFEHYNIS